MGMESFWIKIQIIEKSRQDECLKFLSKYEDALSYSLDDNQLFIRGCTGSFLPSCTLLYKFLVESQLIQSNYEFDTFGKIISMNFTSKKDFINYMFNCWENKLDGLYSQLGTLIIHPTNFYKTQRKLHKKYYKKIQ